MWAHVVWENKKGKKEKRRTCALRMCALFMRWWYLVKNLLNLKSWSHLWSRKHLRPWPPHSHGHTSSLQPRTSNPAGHLPRPPWCAGECPPRDGVCLGDAQVGSHLPSACLPLPFRLNHTAPHEGGHSAPPGGGLCLLHPSIWPSVCACPFVKADSDFF